MEAIDLDAVAAARLVRDPFDFAVVPGFVRKGAFEVIAAAFPTIAGPGSLPIDALELAPAFQAFIDALRAPRVTVAFGRLFGLDLAPFPTMITLRGQARAGDGAIHTDSRAKIVTALIYLNASWPRAEGRLRLLKSARDIDDMAAEIEPARGTLVAFRRSDRSFHGHTPFEGERRVVQFNWVQDAGVVRRELARHRFSARVKRVRRALGFVRA